MMKTLFAGILLSSLAMGIPVASAATMEPAKMGDTTKGKAWLDARGM